MTSPPPQPSIDEETAERLRKDGRRLGAARRQVVEKLAGYETPVSAEELAAELPSVHVSSVYRSLSALEDLGIVRHIHLAHGPARYELTGDAPTSQYLVCGVCGRDVAVPTELFDRLRHRIEQDYGFVLEGGHVALAGHCTGCDPDLAARSHRH